jgi:hypothetical protein
MKDSNCLRCVIIVAAARLCCGAAGAADWYWRPAGTTHGSGDGSSYADAWNSTARIDWNRMADGDTLYVCGTHDSGGADDRSLGAARSNIIISGYCDNGSTHDHGTVVAASARISSWTSGPDSAGVWTYSMVAQGPPVYAMNENRERVYASPAPLSFSTPCNRFHDTGSAISYKPCRPPGAAAPPTLYLAQVGDGGAGLSTFITATAIRNITVTGLSLYLYYTAFRFHGGSNIVIDNVTMQLGSFMNEFVHLDGLVNGFTLRHSVLCDGGNGLYGVAAYGINDSAADRQDNATVEGNTFCMLRANSDSHGIGLQNGNDWVIRGNRFHEIEGTAITLFLPSSGPTPRGWTFRNHLIEDNVISGIHAFPAIAGHTHSTWQRGIEITGDIGCDRMKDDMRNIVIRNNFLSDLQKGGIYVQAPQTSDGEYAVRVIGNTIDNIRDPRDGFGIMWSDRLPPGCSEGANFPAASVLIAGNTIRRAYYSVSVYTGTPVSHSTNFVDLSQVALMDNNYSATGYLVWPASVGEPRWNRKNCLSNWGEWGSLEGSCRFMGARISGLQKYSGREQGSVVE